LAKTKMDEPNPTVEEERFEVWKTLLKVSVIEL